jgi:glycolate oxidase
LPDGEVVWLGTTPEGGEDVAGYDLRGAVIGCEGRFGIVTRVLVRLVPVPESVRTMLLDLHNMDGIGSEEAIWFEGAVAMDVVAPGQGGV